MSSEKKNPYAIGFGIKPLNYIKQNHIISEIVDEFNEEYIQHPCYMLSGVRGSGKTVTMVSIGEMLSTDDKWIIIRLNPEADLLTELAAKLYDSNKFYANFINAEINLSAFGIGISAKSVPPAASIESALEKVLKKIKEDEKRVLVEIDEVSNTKQLKLFAHSFQTFLGSNLPIFLLMTGLHKNIKDLQDEVNCTFLYRAEEMTMDPLNKTLISNSYRETLGVSDETAWDMAVLTKGYPVAYQIVGKYMWENGEKRITDEYLWSVDKSLERYVYSKIWSELSDKDKWYLSYICMKDTMTTEEILNMTSQKKNEFSQYRARLADKGIIDTRRRGVISIALPRFGEFVKRKIDEE